MNFLVKKMFKAENGGSSAIRMNDTLYVFF